MPMTQFSKTLTTAWHCSCHFHSQRSVNSNCPTFTHTCILKSRLTCIWDYPLFFCILCFFSAHTAAWSDSLLVRVGLTTLTRCLSIFDTTPLWWSQPIWLSPCWTEFLQGNRGGTGGFSGPGSGTRLDLMAKTNRSCQLELYCSDHPQNGPNQQLCTCVWLTVNTTKATSKKPSASTELPSFSEAVLCKTSAN